MQDQIYESTNNHQPPIHGHASLAPAAVALVELQAVVGFWIHLLQSRCVKSPVADSLPPYIAQLVHTGL